MLGASSRILSLDHTLLPIALLLILQEACTTLSIFCVWLPHLLVNVPYIRLAIVLVIIILFCIDVWCVVQRSPGLPLF